MKYIYNQRSYETRGVDGRRRCRSSALYWSRLSSCESGAASYNLGSVVVVELRYSCVFVCFVCMLYSRIFFFFFFQAEDGIRDLIVTGVQTCALPISPIAEVRDRRRPQEIADNVSTLIAGDHRGLLSGIGAGACRGDVVEQEIGEHLEIGRASCRERV